MLKAKLKGETVLKIPENLAKKLELKEGDTIEAVVEKGNLVFLGKKDKVSKIMQYAGIWQNEDVDEVFHEIRKGWDKWQRNLSA
jgi:bifunctional DNA-binding transcriptional regulator/antitoxin component of YhaV-PrlF toxin-antitoxin module